MYGNLVVVGDVIHGKYRVLRLIGEGGMGTVYEARHELLGVSVALKFLHPDISEQSSLKQRFLQEARVGAAIQSPHIVRTIDVDTDENGAFLVMELLEGEPLSHQLEREHALDLPTAMKYFLQLLEGVSAAHGVGVVHRDLKPDNVFVTRVGGEPFLKILDFGIAKLRQSTEYKMTLTRPGAVMGTPEYMAPEQAFSADLADSRSDVYSLGVILFEMLSGKLPVEGDNPQVIAEQILTAKIRRLNQLCPDLPPGLVNVVHRAMAADPDERWRDASALRDALLPFVPTTAAARDLAARRSEAPFAGLVHTPRIDGAKRSVEPASPPTRAEGRAANAARSEAPGATATNPGLGAPVGAPDEREPAAVKTAPPDSGGPLGVVAAAPQRTVAMPEPKSVGPGTRRNRRLDPVLAATPTALREPPRSSRLWVVVAAVAALLGAGLGLLFVLSAKQLPPEPPRPVRRVVAAVPQTQSEAFEEDLESFDGDWESQPAPRPRELPADRGGASPVPSLATPLPTFLPQPAGSGGAVTPSAPSMVTIPAIPLPALPTVLALPTAFPIQIPTILPLPMSQPAGQAGP